jgi:regulator of RNase E activity RraA
MVARFRTLPVANVSDSMSRMTGGGATLRPMHRSGGIVVCDASGDMTNSLMGELMLAHAIKRGVAGFVLMGAVRDSEAFLERNLPVFATGITHRGPYRDGPGEIGFPISLAGMLIEPGDLMIGDWDGVLAVPRLEAAAVCARAEAKHKAEEKQMRVTEDGTIDRSWVDKVLGELGCELIP